MQKPASLRIIVFTLLVFLCLSGTAFAAIESVIAKNAKGEYFVYDYAEVLRSYTQKILQQKAPLYEDFAQKSVVAVSSAKSGYIDYADVLASYTSSIVKGQAFDLLQYIETKEAKRYTPVAGTKKVSEKNGSLVFTDWDLPADNTLLQKINAVKDAEAMVATLVQHAAELELNLTAFQNLTLSQQKQVGEKVLQKRPQGGYTSLNALKQELKSAFNHAVSAQNEALKAVNEAKTTAQMRQALQKNASVLDLKLTAFLELQPQEQELVLADLVKGRPYATAFALQEAFTAAMERDRSVLSLINEITENKAMQDALVAHAEALRLQLDDYHRLNTFGKVQVADQVLRKRPAGGYPDIAQVKTVFETAVTNALNAQNKALQAVNQAVTPESLRTIFSAHALVLELDLTRFNRLQPAVQDTVLEILFAGRPYSTVHVFQNAFHNALNSLESTRIIQYVDYPITFNEVVTRQMNCNPQTDLLGGGWQTADRNLVAYYLNADNFMEEMRPAAIIKAGPARMRSGPGLTYDLVTLLETGSGPYFIIDQAEDSSGYTWYRLLTDYRAGWVREDLLTLTARKGEGIFQFLVLSESTNVNPAEINEKILQGKGILEGMADVFVAAARRYNLNEVFLVALALHESGEGRSLLANGVEYNGTVVYNMFGIGAIDADPILKGAERAYQEGWFTPEEAIFGGAKFISEQYINHPLYHQNTLYKMRWNPAYPGEHQYATDIGWAYKQVVKIKTLYDQLTTYVLRFEIPRYK
ncbi:MAG: hypothetical protein GX197_02460 [Firmicutes bacterium]|nr:hypothetical protein [Bacillota bacterium]